MATTTILGTTLTLSPPALTLLRLTPLLSTTASLTHAYMEWLTTTSFLGVPPIDTRLARTMVESVSTPSSQRGASSPSKTPSDPPTQPAAKTLPKARNPPTQASDLVVPAWFTAFFSTGVYSVIGLNTLTLASSAANLFLFPVGGKPLGTWRSWYVLGALGAVAHYAFVPAVAGSVGRMFEMCAVGGREGEETEEKEAEGKEGGKKEEEEEGEGKARALVREWVGWHKVRWGSVDVVAWVGFAVGVVGVLSG